VPAARRVATVVAVSVLAWLLPVVAHAAEGEKAFTLGIDYSAWSVDQPDHPGTDHDSITAQGVQATSDYEYGWNDTLWLRASVSGGYFSVPDGSAWSTGGIVGITYALDVLRYVPFVHAGVGALVIGGDGLFTEIRPVVELGVGLTVLEGRTFSWGVVAHFDGTYSKALFFSIGPRLAWRWGFF
jgi:hypothetical protein